MPRVGPRRPNLVIRIGDEVRAVIEDHALADGVVKADGEPNVSEMVRKLIDEALAARERRARRKRI